jgi:hypothetical protein
MMMAHFVVAILLLVGFFLIYYMGKKDSEARTETDNRIKELEWEIGRLTYLLEHVERQVSAIGAVSSQSRDFLRTFHELLSRVPASGSSRVDQVSFQEPFVDQV